MRATASTSKQDGQSTTFSISLLIWAVLIIVRDATASAPHITESLLLIVQPLWIYRATYNDATWKLDLLICLLSDSWATGGLGLLRPGFREWIRNTQAEHAPLYGILLVILLCSLAIVVRGESVAPGVIGGDQRKRNDYFLPPLLIPSRTNHSRIFPKKHSFSYSYFYVGIPVGWRGRSGSALSADVNLSVEPSKKYGWFHVDGADYLGRDNSDPGLDGKLRSYLHSQEVPDEDWTFAYLVTAPRFLGYSFNPVSFWYLYDADVNLVMMILEVNNTFDERRMYLLKAEKTLSHNGAVVSDDVEGLEKDDLPANAVKFTNSWEKDFHVSPFNSRKGFYKLTANDPLASNPGQDRMIDNTIVLKSSKDHAKLVARVFSEGRPQDPAKLSTFALTKFLLSWFWVGFVTFPRIVREAGKLYFKQNLNVFFRPEVMASSIGRKPTADEVTLEAFFRAYIAHLIKQCPFPLRVIYQPPNELGDTATWATEAKAGKTDNTPELGIRILSPAFYSRFIHYAHTAEGFDREGHGASDKNRTIAFTNPDLLPTLLGSPQRPDAATAAAAAAASLTLLDRLRWRLLRSLRCPPPASSYPSQQPSSMPTDPAVSITDIRAFAHSPLDTFVMAQCSTIGNDDGDGDNGDAAVLYRRAVTKLFLAQRYAFGVAAAVSLADFLLRVLLVLGARRFGGANGWTRGDGVGWGGTAAAVAGANTVHLWALLKGFGA